MTQFCAARWLNWQWLPALLLLALPQLAPAQAPVAKPGQAVLADCVRELPGDSVALYYDERYAFTPVRCATVRRVTHLDAKSDFDGVASDYQIDTERLTHRQHYAHGRRQGRYESYYDNGQLKMRGSFNQGEPSGEWQFWYASGKPWQTLRWDAVAQQPWRFLAYWDETGQQLLTGGNGRWQETDPRQHRRIEGAVVNELPEGDWQVYLVEKQKLLLTETYQRGGFKTGHDWSGVGAANYRDKSRISLHFDDYSAAAERFDLGITCEEIDRRQTVQQASDQRIVRLKPNWAAGESITMPKPEGYAGNYLTLLLQKLSATASMSALLRNPQYTAEVTADVDELGKLHNFQSSQPDIQRVFLQIVPPLGRWNFATLNRQPVRSHVRFVLNVVDAQWQVRYQASIAAANKPAAP